MSVGLSSEAHCLCQVYPKSTNLYIEKPLIRFHRSHQRHFRRNTPEEKDVINQREKKIHNKIDGYFVDYDFINRSVKWQTKRKYSFIDNQSRYFLC